jgi:hypothetical protein
MLSNATPTKLTQSFNLIHKKTPCVRIKAVSYDPVVMFAKDEFLKIFAAATGNPSYCGQNGYYYLYLGIAGNGSSKICDKLMAKYNMTREKLGDEGFLLAAVNERIVCLTSFSGKGVLNGIYKILEKTLGASYPRPLVKLNFIEPIETSKSITLPYIDKPAFNLRGLSLSRMVWKYPSFNMLDWMGRTGLNFQALNMGSFQCTSWAMRARGFKLNTSGHALLFWIPPSEYGKSNPEYFSMQNGKRVPKSRGSQLAFGNKSVIDLLVKKMTEYKKKYPNIQTLAFGANDSASNGMGFGNDPESVKLDSPLDIPAKGSKAPRFYTTRYVRAANMIISELNKTWPKLQLHIYAYNMNGGTVAPPNCEVNPNVKIEFCLLYRCYQHALNDPNCPRNRMFCEWLKTWASKTKNIYIREYYIQIGESFPITNLFVLKKDIEFYRSLGILGVVPETIPDGPNGANVAQNQPYSSWLLPPTEYIRFWDNNALLHFAFSRLMWNPAESLKSIVDMFCKNYYGPAWKPMAAYHLAMNKNAYLISQPGQKPAPEKVKNYSGWIFYGPWCKCWNWRPRLTPAAYRFFNIKRTKDLSNACRPLLKNMILARNIAKKSCNRKARARVDKECQILQKYLLSLGYEIDWRKSTPGKVKFSQTPQKGVIIE